MTKYLVTLGDSVHWGQGLLAVHKLHRIVAGELRKTQPELVEHLLAHSGAIIGAGATIAPERVDGEVPIAYPTLFQQLDGFVGDPDDVLAVLVNGGINDVDIRRILSPITPLDHLRDLTRKHCGHGMKTLLEAVVARIPVATIIVTPYYPVLSYDSSLFRIPSLLEQEGVTPTAGAAGLIDGKNPVVERCLLFWRESEAALRWAVNGVASARVVLADPGFTERNAVFASEPLLWGLSKDLQLSPQDEVIAPRHAACNVAIPPFDIARREQCYRASAGHPNVAGARRYADAIIEALGLVAQATV